MSMPARFQFDCPACSSRTEITVGQRGELLRCAACGVSFPGPNFPLGRRRSVLRPTDRDYACRCPQCNLRMEIRESDAGAQVVCPLCGRLFRQPAPPWEQWRRPVAKFLTREDQRRSLHHLMLSTDRVFLPDERLEPRARRWFEFYCGACGRLQQARVWEIATQQRCDECDVLLIVPTPCRRGSAARPTAADWSAAQAPDVLFCPQCGRRITPADRQRRRLHHCPTCRHWF